MVHLTPEQHVFVTERHLATLTTLRADGTPHVVPVGFTWDPDEGVLRITTRSTSAKVRNVETAVHTGPLLMTDVDATAAIAAELLALAERVRR